MSERLLSEIEQISQDFVASRVLISNSDLPLAQTDRLREDRAMRSKRFLVTCFTVIALAPAASAQTAWKMPRLADGRPDLQGVWENNSATPLERPKEFAGKPRLTDAEVQQLKQRAATIFGPESDAVFGDALYLALLDETRARRPSSTGSYSSNWLPERVFEARTSLIESPADGRLPPLTPEALRLSGSRSAGTPNNPASARELNLKDRCISYGVPDLWAAHMSFYRIVQTTETVAIQMERIHDVRIIPLDGRSKLSAVHRRYLGEPRGHWEGDTLVVETVNFHPDGNYLGGLLNQADHNMKLTERLTLQSADTLRYEFTVDDPTVWTSPWTGAIYWRRAKSEMYEYACHEGNYSLRGILSGARAAEGDRTDK